MHKDEDDQSRVDGCTMSEDPYCPLCGLKVAALLAVLKEMRDAMAATMRVISMHDDHDRIIEEMSREFKSLGIQDGFGVRSQQAIAEVEGRCVDARSTAAHT